MGQTCQRTLDELKPLLMLRFDVEAEVEAAEVEVELKAEVTG